MEGQVNQDKMQEVQRKGITGVSELTGQTGKDRREQEHNGRICVGKYSLIGSLGQGGEGSVYLARDEHLQRFVAIKHVHGLGAVGEEPKNSGCFEKEDDQDRTDQNGERQEVEKVQIMREAGYLRQLSHPMLPAVYDLSEDGSGGWYLVMEYIQGETLHTYIERNGYVQESQALIWAGQMVDVLDYLHTRKPPVIYSDLKPDNIMVCLDGQLRLVDFGAALTRSFGADRNKVLAVTPGYGAPEQSGNMQGCQGLNHAGVGVYADERSDIYALGKVLYYMVTGAEPSKPPYTALPVYEYQPLLSHHLETVIRKCINAEPEQRYQTAEEVQRDLARSEGRGRRVRRKSFIRVIEKRIWLTEGRGEHLVV